MASAPSTLMLPELGPSSAAAAVDNNPADADADGVDVPEVEDADDKWEGRANFFVAVRVRPRVAIDRNSADEIVRATSATELLVRTPVATTAPTAEMLKPSALRPLRKPPTLSPVKRSHPNQVLERRFTFDRVFSPRDGQPDVYAQTARALIPGVLRGCNATVLAYGCTGAGKTFTMLGTPEDPGLMARALDDLFQRIRRRSGGAASKASATSVTFRVAVSFLEVYNETIRDLLAGSTGPTTAASAAGLDLREDPVRGVATVAGLSEIEVRTAKEVLALLRKGHRRRAQEATAANGASSRSHALLQVLVESKETTTEDSPASAGPQTSARSTTVVKVGKLSLVDLAGSERAAVTQNRGLRLVEGANINRSLLALGNCINALADKASTAASSASFVPYRDSKLTRLLKDALGGNCRTVLIANVSPAAASAEETVHTLQYATRARAIQTTVASNVVVWTSSADGDEWSRSARPDDTRTAAASNETTTAYEGVISGLRGEIDALRKALSDQQRAEAVELPPLVKIHKSPVSARSSPVQKHSSPPRKHGSPVKISSSVDNNSNNNNADDEHDGDPHADDQDATDEEPTDDPQMDAQIRAARSVIADAFATQRRHARELQTAEDALRTAVQSLRGVDPSLVLPLASTSPDPGEKTDPGGDSASQHKELAERALQLQRDREEARAKLSASATRLQALRRRVDALPTALRPSASMSQSLVRELLLLEFRVGELEYDKLALELACSERARAADAGEGDDQWLSELAAAFPRPATSDQPSADPQAPSLQQESQLLELLEPLSSARRQWGMQMRNPSLPYIRRSKPAAVSTLPALAAPAAKAATGASSARVALPSISSPASSGLAAFTAPYLKVLKQRHRQQATSSRHLRKR